VASNTIFSAESATFTGPLTVETGGTFRTTGGTINFPSNVLVSAGARWELPTGVALQLSGVVTNRGTLRWVSDNNTFNLSGSGRVENLGLWEIFQDPAANNGFESFVQVPVNVPAGGKFLVSTNARVDFSGPSELAIAGELEVQQGARLRFDASQALALAPGSLSSGAGTIRFEGSSHLTLAADLSVAIGLLDFTGISGISGTSLLSIPNGSILRFDHNSTFGGSITLDGTLTLTDSSVTFTINGTLTLDASGFLNNPGNLKVGAFVNNAPPDHIIGNPPVGLSASPPLRILAIELSPSSGGVQKVAGIPASRDVILSCGGLIGQRFVIEKSTDLTHWSNEGGVTNQFGSGTIQVRIPPTSAAAGFYRLRLLIGQ
jgi:hypothetical protein